MSSKSGQAPPEDLLRAVVEAVIFATGEPVDPREIADAFRGLDEDTVERTLEEISREYERGESGLLLERQWMRDTTNDDKAAWLDSLVGGDGAHPECADAARTLYRELALLEPQARGFEHPLEWSAFIHVGA